jgi:ankyrin repeat protein
VADGHGFQPDRSEREALMLETVKLAIELGVDVNAVNTDGRTALDAARALKLEPVVNFLLDKEAKPGIARESNAARALIGARRRGALAAPLSRA